MKVSVIVPFAIGMLTLWSGSECQAQRFNGEKNTPPARGERQRTFVKVGDKAPDWELPMMEGTKKVKLSSFQGKQPVVLIFGSYT